MAITHSMIVLRDHAVRKRREKELWGWSMVVSLSLGAIGLWAGLDQVFQPGDSSWTAPALIVGLTASGAGLCVATWYKKAKDEYDRLRMWIMTRLGVKLCDCLQPGCDCREQFMRECKENYNLNLFYYK